MSIKRILITGINGSIGTRLYEKLLESGYQIMGVDNKPNEWHKKINEITVFGDIRYENTIKKIPKNIDLVIHLAANARVYDLVKDPKLAKENFVTSFNILEFCRKNKINRIIFASSREVYGNSKKPTHSENEAYVSECESPYTASKIGGEALIHAYHQCYGIDFIIVRLSNVYGMYDVSSRVVPRFIKLTKENKDLIVYGKSKFLDFTYIDDAVNGIVKCVQMYEEIKNDIFNIASGTGISLVELAQLIIKSMNGSNKIIMRDSRKGEILRFVADIKKLKELTGYMPKIPISEGIIKTIEWYDKNVNWTHIN